MSTYIIAGVIAAAVVLVIVKLLRDKTKGKTCNCSGCSESCHKK